MRACVLRPLALAYATSWLYWSQRLGEAWSGLTRECRGGMFPQGNMSLALGSLALDQVRKLLTFVPERKAGSPKIGVHGPGLWSRFSERDSLLVVYSMWSTSKGRRHLSGLPLGRVQGNARREIGDRSSSISTHSLSDFLWNQSEMRRRTHAEW